MKLPLWILGAALLFWGGCTGALALAFPIAVLAVGPRYLRRRFDFATAEFHRALDVCWVLFLGGLLLVYGRESMGNVLRTFARWLPLVFAPALLAQVWSARGRLPLSAILPLPWWRRQVDLRGGFDAVPPFVILCLLSASTTAGVRPWFYAGLLAVTGSVLWSNRPAGTRPWGAALVLAMAGVVGWQLADRIGEAQQELENRFLTWVTQFRRDESANRMARTSIGRNGPIGGSSRVVLRMRGDGQHEPPARLRVATFSAWRGGNWHAPLQDFEKVEGTGDEWPLQTGIRRAGWVEVELVRDLTGGLLALPPSASIIGDLPADRVERTPMGAVRAVMPGGVVGYRADFADTVNWEAEPTEEDRFGVPPLEQPAVAAVVEELGLRGLPAAEVVARLEKYFSSRFRYSTGLVDAMVDDRRAVTPVGRFLLGHRTGHCEFFATAAVLLLRQAGVSARYATGYLVAAGEREGEFRLVRERHAHAWVLVRIDDRWREFDPTPPTDLDDRSETLSWYGRLGQGWSNLRFGFSRWWWLGEKRLLRQVYWLILPLLLLLLWRLRRVREVVSGEAPETSRPAPVWPGLDSEWFAADLALAESGWSRGLGEDPTMWQKRLERAGWPGALARVAAGGRRLHERLRFDPRGLDEAERQALRRAAGEVLDGVTERRRAEAAALAAAGDERPEISPVAGSGRGIPPAPAG